MQILTDIFKTIVTNAATIYGSDIYFFYGHPKEINTVLARKDKTRSFKYPAIFFFLGLDVIRDSRGYFGKCSPVFAIVNETKGTYITQDRIDNNFKTVIWPIYEAFIQALQEDVTVSPIGGNLMQFNHTYHDHYFYGSDENAESKKAFDDQLDAMTIEFDELIIEKEKC